MRRLLFLLTLAALVPAAGAQSLFADVVARRPGDVITVVLAERTQAQRQSAYDSESQSGFSGGAYSGTLGGQFDVDARYLSDDLARTRATQSDALTGTVSVVVTEVDAAGNLIVEGERSVNVNGTGQTLRVAGLVRPTDVRAGNVVFSYQIANAAVDYRQTGMRHKFFRPGFLTKVAAVAVLVGAIVLGGSAVAGAADTVTEAAAAQ